MAHQVDDNGKDADICLNLAGDEKSMGGMGPFIEDLVLLGGGRIEKGGAKRVSLA